MIGKKTAEKPFITGLTERKIRVSIWLKLRDHSTDAMMEALEQLKEESLFCKGAPDGQRRQRLGVYKTVGAE